MNKHLGKFIVDNIELPKGELYKDVDETVIDGIKDITLYFSEIDTLVRLTQIAEIELLPNRNIFVKGCLFSPALYNAYIENYTIKRIVENGFCINPLETEKEGNYSTEYYNYRFKEFSCSRDNEYSFILEQI